MSNFSAKILRNIVAKEFHKDPKVVRVSGHISELPTYKDWYGFYQSGACYCFLKIEQGLEKPIFLVSVYKERITIHG